MSQEIEPRFEEPEKSDLTEKIIDVFKRYKGKASANEFKAELAAVWADASDNDLVIYALRNNANGGNENLLVILKMAWKSRNEYKISLGQSPVEIPSDTFFEALAEIELKRI